MWRNRPNSQRFPSSHLSRGPWPCSSDQRRPFSLCLSLSLFLSLPLCDAMWPEQERDLFNVAPLPLPVGCSNRERKRERERAVFDSRLFAPELLSVLNIDDANQSRRDEEEEEGEGNKNLSHHIERKRRSPFSSLSLFLPSRLWPPRSNSLYERMDENKGKEEEEGGTARAADGTLARSPRPLHVLRPPAIMVSFPIRTNDTPTRPRMPMLDGNVRDRDRLRSSSSSVPWRGVGDGLAPFLLSFLSLEPRPAAQHNAP